MDLIAKEQLYGPHHSEVRSIDNLYIETVSVSLKNGMHLPRVLWNLRLMPDSGGLQTDLCILHSQKLVTVNCK